MNLDYQLLDAISLYFSDYLSRYKAARKAKEDCDVTKVSNEEYQYLLTEYTKQGFRLYKVLINISNLNCKHHVRHEAFTFINDELNHLNNDVDNVLKAYVTNQSSNQINKEFINELVLSKNSDITIKREMLCELYERLKPSN